MDYTHPQYWPQLLQLAQTIDTIDYFQILNIAQDANRRQVQQSYYQLSRALHPDKFHHVEDANLKAAVNKIFKRVTEAYQILKDDQRRTLYTENINGPDRNTMLRYNEQQQQQEREKERERKEVAKTPQGKKLYQAAVADMQKQEWDSAYRNVQSALMFEMGNEQLESLKKELDVKRKG